MTNRSNSSPWLRRVSSLLLGASIALGLTAAQAETAEAQVCFRKGAPLPYFFTGNDPIWYASGLREVRPELNEPRWGASPLTAFINDKGNVATSEGGYRLILSDDSKELSVSIQNKSGDPLSTSMAVYFGIYNVDNGKAYAWDIPVFTTLTRQNNAGYDSYKSLIAHSSKTTSTAWTPGASDALPPALVASSIRMWTNQPVADGGADWAIQFRVRLLDVVGIGVNTNFKVFIGMRRPLTGTEESLVSVPYVDKTVDKIENTAIPSNTDLWFTVPKLGAGCPNGVVVKGETIGSTNTPADVINMKLGQHNTFVADVDLGSDNINPATGLPRIAPGQLKARFRVANWGAQIDQRFSDTWRDVPKGQAVLSQTATHFSFDCGESKDGVVCDTLPVPDIKANPDLAHQCMMVEVNNAGTTTFPVSIGAGYNNMRFDTLSSKLFDADISIKGLLAQTGVSKDRRVILKVVTRNMPKIGNLPIFLDFQLLNWLKTLLLGFAQAVNPFGLSLSNTDMMKIAWPTYEVHAYYDTGRTNKYKNGKTFKEYSPMISYGHYLSHDGVFFGYNHKLLGLTQGLTSHGSDTWSVLVPKEGKVRVTSAVASEDLPAILVPSGDRTCQLWPQLCDQ